MKSLLELVAVGEVVTVADLRPYIEATILNKADHFEVPDMGGPGFVDIAPSEHLPELQGETHRFERVIRDGKARPAFKRVS